MKDIPLFDTDTGVSSLVLKEIPYRQTAYIRIRSVQPGGLEAHLKECAGFCRMCGAERIYATGHAELEKYPLYCAVRTMSRRTPDWEPTDHLFPVTEPTVARWREIYNDRMSAVDNAATLTARDEQEILNSRGAYFVHRSGKLLGIGWLRDEELMAVASVVPGAGERVMKTLLTAASEDRVTLDVASTNTRAIALYERLGFVTVGERCRWYHIT